MRRREHPEPERLTMPHGTGGMIGGVPNEVSVTARGDGMFNVDSWFQPEQLEHRLVLSRDQLADLGRKIGAAL